MAKTFKDRRSGLYEDSTRMLRNVDKAGRAALAKRRQADDRRAEQELRSELRMLREAKWSA